MDSQEAANQAQIKTYWLTLWQLVITIILGILTLVLTLRPSPQGGLMLSARPILIILLSSTIAVSAISLIVVTFRRLKTKRLIAEMVALKTELGNERESAKTLGETAHRLKGENQELTKKNSELGAELNTQLK